MAPIGQTGIVKFHQVSQSGIAGDAKISQRDALRGVEKESLASAMVSVSNQQGRESIRFTDRMTLARQQLGQLIKEGTFAVLKLLPGPDAFFAINDVRALCSKGYHAASKEMKEKHAQILLKVEQLTGLNNREKEDLASHLDACVKAAEKIPPDLAYDILQYRDMQQSAAAKKSELRAGVMNAVGTTIGVGWAATAAASKTTSLVAEQVASLAAEGATGSTAVAGSVLNLVAAGILIPLQLFLIGRNVAHINTSRHHMQRIATDSAALNAFKNINNPSDNRLSQHSNDVRKNINKGINAAQELLERRKTYSKYQIAGSITSTVGDTTTLVSGILTLTGVGAIVGIPVSVFGFIVSITGTALRSITQGKEDRFIGKAASGSAREKMVSNASSTGVNGAKKTIQDDARLMNNYQVRVAENKLHAILHQVIKDAEKGKVKTEDGVLTKQAFLQEVERRADKLINRLKKTSLLDSDLQEMKTLLQNKYLPRLLPADNLAKSAETEEKTAINLGAVQEKLHARLEKNMNDDDMKLKVSAETVKKINKAMTKELFLLRHGYGNVAIRAAFMDEAGKKKAILTEGDIKALREKYPHVKAIYDKIASQHLIAQLKTDTRALRHHATETFINSAHVAVIDEKHAEIKTTAF